MHIRVALMFIIKLLSNCKAQNTKGVQKMNFIFAFPLWIVFSFQKFSFAKISYAGNTAWIISGKSLHQTVALTMHSGDTVSHYCPMVTTCGVRTASMVQVPWARSPVRQPPGHGDTRSPRHKAIACTSSRSRRRQSPRNVKHGQH